MIQRQLNPKNLTTVWRQRGFHYEQSGTGFDEASARAAGPAAHSAWWRGRRAARSKAS